MAKDNGWSRRITICISVFFGLILIYLFTLTTMYSFGNQAVIENVNGAISILQNEGDYPDAYIYEIPSRLDNYTDKIMVSKALKGYEGDSFKQAMDNSGYSRYWHGYLVWLKPMLKFLTYPDIRTLLGCLQIVSLCVGFYFITKALGFKISIPYILSWILVYGVVSTFSLQYFSAFFVTSLTCAVLGAVYCYTQTVNRFFYIMLFVVVGSLINFLDLLTFPVITLCVPMVILLTRETNKAKSVGENFITVIICSMAWGVSYGVTWLTKWIIASVSLGKNVVADALEQIVFRTGGSQAYPIDRVQVLKSNLSCIKILEFFVTTPWVWIIIVLIILLLGNWNHILKALPLLLVALIPYVWYEVLCSHSAIHVFFTYKSQMGTVFALLVFLLMCIVPDKVKIQQYKGKVIGLLVKLKGLRR